MINFNNVKIFSGSSNVELASRIAEKIGLQLGKAEIQRFKDGEVYIEIEETVRGRDVFVVQSTSEPVNENLMELLIFVDALRRASAKTINVIIPYYGYARQDRKSKPREPITSKLVANLLTTAGVNRVITMDLHADQIQGFFDIPVDHMQGLPLMAKYFKEKGFYGDDIVVVSPDVGGVKRARKLAEKLDCKIAIIDKRRPKPNIAEVMNLIGEVEGKIAIFIDDMIDTAGTICNAAQALIEKGAVEVYACATHAVFSGPALERLRKSAFTRVVITDSIYLPEEQRFDKLRILSTSKMFAETIKRITTSEPISNLFEMPIEEKKSE